MKPKAVLRNKGPERCMRIEDTILQLKGTIQQIGEKVKSAILTPHSVLKASGHVDRFHDLMVQDEETKQAMRADHLLEDHMETLIKDGELSQEEIEKCQLHLAKADAYSREELGAILKEYNIVNPETGNAITDPFEFKLMFATQFGPSSDKVVYLH